MAERAYTKMILVHPDDYTSSKACADVEVAQVTDPATVNDITPMDVSNDVTPVAPQRDSATSDTVTVPATIQVTPQLQEIVKEVADDTNIVNALADEPVAGPSGMTPQMLNVISNKKKQSRPSVADEPVAGPSGMTPQMLNVVSNKKKPSKPVLQSKSVGTVSIKDTPQMAAVRGKSSGTGESRVHACTYCDKVFDKKWVRDRHVRNVHMYSDNEHIPKPVRKKWTPSPVKAAAQSARKATSGKVKPKAQQAREKSPIPMDVARQSVKRKRNETDELGAAEKNIKRGGSKRKQDSDSARNSKKSTGVFPCKYCESTFATARARDEHESHRHRTGRVFPTW